MKKKFSLDDIISITTHLKSNDILWLDGLVIEYALEEENHIKLDEFLFFKTNPNASKKDFKHQNILEVTINDIHFRFIKKNE